MLLTSKQAAIIAESQIDLGGVGQKNLALVLSDEGARLNLDPISEIIANTIGGCDNLEDAENELAYGIEQLTRAKEAISKLQ